MKQSHHRSVLVATLLVVAWCLHVAGPSASAQVVWDAGGDGVNWSDGVNWVGDSTPGGGSSVQFDNTGGLGTTNIVNDAPRTISGLNIRNTSGQHTINLNGSTLSFDTNNRQFRVADSVSGSSLHMYNGTFNLLTNAWFLVGYKAGRVGTLTFGSGTTLLSHQMDYFLVGEDGGQGYVDLSSASGTLSVRNTGYRIEIGGGTSASGTVLLGSVIDTYFGTSASDRTALYVGANYNSSGNTTGTLIKTGGHFEAYMQDSSGYSLSVGNNNSGSGPSTATGLIDLTGTTSGTFSISGSNVRIGRGNGTGTVHLGSGVTASFGVPANPIDFRIAEAFSGGSSAGTLTKSGGEFNAYFGTLYVGYNHDGGGGSASGVLNLTGTTSGVLSNSGSDLRIGAQRDATGTVHLGNGKTVLLGKPGFTSLFVGKTFGTGGTASAGTFTMGSGTMDAYFAQMHVGHNGNSSANSATGYVDLSGVTSGTITNDHNLIGEVWVGYGRNATGTLLLGATDDQIGASSSSRTRIRVGDNTDNHSGTLSAGTLTKSGGSFEGWFNEWHVGYNGNTSGNSVNGTMDLSGTTFTANGINSSDTLYFGVGRDATGLVRLPSGNVTAPNMIVGDSDTGTEAGGSGTLDLRGTTFTVSNTGSINTSGNLMGRGTLTAATFIMNGRTTATNGTLTVSYSTFNNTVENPTSGGNGWRAISGGRLDLPLVAVSAGNVSRNWGESSGDTTIDLVNSVRASFTGATAGDWQVSLLAPDHALAQPGLQNVIGLWDINAINGLTFSSVDLTFRYDLELATTLGVSESNLKLFRYDGSQWQLMTGFVLNTTDKHISYAGATGFSQWAIATDLEVIPEPSTVFLLLVGGAIAYRKLRRA